MSKQKKSILVLTIFVVIALTLFLPGLCNAGSLEPTEPPGPTMKTLDEIYKKISNVSRFPQCEGRRFLDLMDGTVADCNTGLIWMKNAECFGRLGWSDAKQRCHELTSGNCTLLDDSIIGDWRLPSIRELESLVDKNYSLPALSNGEGTGHWIDGDAFISVYWGNYWSATTNASDASSAWCVDIRYGDVNDIGKIYGYHAWCVRGGSGVDPQ